MYIDKLNFTKFTTKSDCFKKLEEIKKLDKQLYIKILNVFRNITPYNYINLTVESKESQYYNILHGCYNRTLCTIINGRKIELELNIIKNSDTLNLIDVSIGRLPPELSITRKKAGARNANYYKISKFAYRYLLAPYSTIAFFMN